MSADSIARALKARRSGGGWMAKCPAHDDNNPSLSIRDADGKVLLHCHAGCGQREVIEALKGNGLWAERPAKPRRKSLRPTITRTKPGICFIRFFEPSRKASFSGVLTAKAVGSTGNANGKCSFTCEK